jgi:hypothetical protein
MPLPAKVYLGDGVYLEYKSASTSLVLTTSDGIRTTNEIVLDSDTYNALTRYVEALTLNRSAD